MTPVMWAAANAGHVLAKVEARIVNAGAVIELHQFQNLSAAEVDVLLWLERNDPVDPQATRPGDPQDAGGTVAA